MKSLHTVLVLVVALALPAAAQEAKGSGPESRSPGAVVVVNRLEQGVSVWINGEMRGRVEPSRQARFGGVPAGQVTLKAAALRSAGPVAGEERELSPGQTFTWTLYPVFSWQEEKGTGTIVLENALDHEVQVTLGESPAGSLSPGATRAYPRVVAGQVTVSATGPDGTALVKRTLSVLPGNIARWTIGAPELGGPAGPAARNAIPRPKDSP